MDKRLRALEASVVDDDFRNDHPELADLLAAVVDSGRSQSAAVLDEATTDGLLAHLSRLSAAAVAVDRRVDSVVAVLRSEGVTWAAIGQALGITRQSAWARFGGADHERPR